MILDDLCVIWTKGSVFVGFISGIGEVIGEVTVGDVFVRVIFGIGEVINEMQSVEMWSGLGADVM